MPISSYPRITLTNTSQNNNPPSGTGITVFDFITNSYQVLDSDTIPIGTGGFANNDTLSSVYTALISNEFVSVANLLENALGQSIANSLLSQDNDSTVGNNIRAILIQLETIVGLLQNGTGAIQIKGSNGNLADVSGANRLNVAV